MCNSKVCKANQQRKFTEIIDEERKNLIQKVWLMTWTEKLVFINDHPKKVETKLKSTNYKNKPIRRVGT